MQVLKFQKAAYDVIVLGAGVSGLLIGSELSKRHSVLVVDKATSLPMNKYWVTEELNNKLIADMITNDCIEAKFSSMDFLTHTGFHHSIRGKYILWNSTRLVRFFQNKILANNSEVVLSSNFYSYSPDRDGVIVHINDSKIRTKIIVDCMGKDSRISYAKGISRIDGFYELYGKRVELDKPINPICLHNIIMGKSPYYLEVFPYNHSAYVALLRPFLKARKKSRIKDMFNEIVNRSAYSKYFADSHEEVVVEGIVPVGVMRRNAINNVFFFGEAAFDNPSATGTCLSTIILKYQLIAEHLHKRILANKLTGNDLQYRLNKNGNFNMIFQNELFKKVIRWNSTDFDAMIHQISNLPDEIINEVLFSRLNMNDPMRYRCLFKKVQLEYATLPILKATMKTLFHK